MNVGGKMNTDKRPKLSQRQRRRVVELWPRISAGDIADIDCDLAAIPIEPGYPEYVIVRAVLSLFLERGPTLIGNFDIYSEISYLFAEVILRCTPPPIVSLMHVAAIPSHFNLHLIAYLVDISVREIEPFFDRLVQCCVIQSDAIGNYWVPPTFRDCLLLRWLRPEHHAKYARIEERLQLWEMGETGEKLPPEKPEPTASPYPATQTVGIVTS
jgi:hypothetical protein